MNTIEEMEKGIADIVLEYKGVALDYAKVFGRNNYATMIKVRHINPRQMPLAAVKILNKYPKIDFVHFTGGWTEYVYTRRTLSYLGYKIINN
jgi:hypothetical protein